MQEYVREHNIKDTPRRLLISSYFGEKIGLSTPLLQWYLKKGLVVTRIYTAVEYIPNAAFQGFSTRVTQAHLEGDRDKEKALIAEMNKLIGNSSYGRTITNKEKHHDILYVNDRQVGEYIMDNHSLQYFTKKSIIYVLTLLFSWHCKYFRCSPCDGVLHIFVIENCIDGIKN